MSENTVHSLEDIAAALDAGRSSQRPLYTYRVPLSISKLTGVMTVALVELTSQELIVAQARGGTDRVAMGFEVAKEAWRKVNDRRISTADGTADTEWARTDMGWSKLRTLIASAYADIHNPKTEENENFLESRSVSV